MVKKSPASARDAGDAGLIPRWGRSLGVGNATHSMDRGSSVTWYCKEFYSTEHGLPTPGTSNKSGSGP